MDKTIETEGVDYKISTKWHEEIKAIKVNLNIKARDWKKTRSLDVQLSEHDLPFILTSSLVFGEEEYLGPDDIDYSFVNLFLSVNSNGRNIYSKQIDVTGRFRFDHSFYITTNQTS